MYMLRAPNAAVKVASEFSTVLLRDAVLEERSTRGRPAGARIGRHRSASRCCCKGNARVSAIGLQPGQVGTLHSACIASP